MPPAGPLTKQGYNFLASSIEAGIDLSIGAPREGQERPKGEEASGELGWCHRERRLLGDMGPRPVGGGAYPS